MLELSKNISNIFRQSPIKTVISKPSKKDNTYIKINIENKENYYQVSKYTEKQVFHNNINQSEIVDFCIKLMENEYRQLNSWSNGYEHMIMISKKGKLSYKRKKTSTNIQENTQHNRKKKYIISEGTDVPPLIDMGIFTKEGKVVHSMYDKFRQINRFIEIIDDEVKNINKESINIIDFGCGKSYLTFVVYYYFTEIKHMNVNIIGLDLKKDVIENCNRCAKKYGYKNLRFQLGDINGYKNNTDVDIVITLHACDTATDYALFNAVTWNTSMIFSVPCCQHELNSQINSKDFSLFTNYGIIQERFSALTTDAIRANLLECCGYKTQLLEFIDLTHTPKNILIRAVRSNNIGISKKEKCKLEVENVIREFNLSPTFYNLLKGIGRI